MFFCPQGSLQRTVSSLIAVLKTPCVHACMRACVHACMRACVHACMRACVHACMRACHACMRACVHACVAQPRSACKLNFKQLVCFLYCDSIVTYGVFKKLRRPGKAL